MKRIFFLSDFGYRDYYVSAVKAVIISIASNVEVIDITHEVEPFNTKQGAFILYQLTPYIPNSSIVLAVVDPGVGTNRRAIVVKTRRLLFVGPDNGLLYPACSRDGIVEIREIENTSIMLPRSGTFDARDVFAPVAAHLAKGFEIERIGKRIDKIVELNLAKASFSESYVLAEALHVDRFGNIVTNIGIREFERWKRVNEKYTVKVKEREYEAHFVSSFQDIREGSLGLIPGSSGFIEISVKEGSASNLTGISAGTEFSVLRLKT